MDNGRFTILLLLIIILGGGSGYYAYTQTTDLQASVERLEAKVNTFQNGLVQINNTANMAKATSDAANAAVAKLVADASAAQQAAEAAAAASKTAAEARQAAPAHKK